VIEAARRDRWEARFRLYDAHDYANLSTIGMALADEEQPEPEAPARIDRLRPEFTEHSGVAAIDGQIRRAERQRGLWDARVRKLAALRQAREAQIQAGTWPSAAAEKITCRTDEEAARG
jgi:hypothetical protein